MFEAIEASFEGVSERNLIECLRLADPEADDAKLRAKIRDEGADQFLVEREISGTDMKKFRFYHLSCREWLVRKRKHDYSINAEKGHAALALVQYMALARDVSAFDDEEVRKNLDEQLDCPKELRSKAMRRAGRAVRKEGVCRVFELV